MSEARNTITFWSGFLRKRCFNYQRYDLRWYFHDSLKREIHAMTRKKPSLIEVLIFLKARVPELKFRPKDMQDFNLTLGKIFNPVLLRFYKESTAKIYNLLNSRWTHEAYKCAPKWNGTLEQYITSAKMEVTAYEVLQVIFYEQNALAPDVTYGDLSEGKALMCIEPGHIWFVRDEYWKDLCQVRREIYEEYTGVWGTLYIVGVKIGYLPRGAAHYCWNSICDGVDRMLDKVDDMRASTAARGKQTKDTK